MSKRKTGAGPAALERSKPFPEICRNQPRTHRLLGLAVCLVIGLTLGPAVGVAAAETGASNAGSATGESAGSSITVSNETVDSNGTSTHRITLTEAPDGLAGYELSLELAGDGVATVSNASYPDRYGMTTDPVVTADGRAVTLEAVDLDDEVAPGATNVTLARVEITATATGEADLRVTDVQVDADGGSRVAPTLEAGALTVVDGGSSSSTGTGADETDSGEPSDSVPGFAVGSALAAIALLAAALLVRPR